MSHSPTCERLPHMIQSYYDSAYDGLFQPARAWGHVAAPGEYAEQIRAVLAEVRELAAERGRKQDEEEGEAEGENQEAKQDSEHGG